MKGEAAMQAQASDVDLRGFRYALEPVERRQRWQLDALQRRLALQQTQLAQARQGAQDLEDERQAVAARAGSVQGQRIDPQSRGRALAYMRRLAQQHRDALERVDELDAACAQARSDCIQAQLRLQGLQAHRASALAEFATEQRQREAGERDREWLARRRAPAAVKENP